MSLLGKVYDYARHLLLLKEQTDKNRADIEALQEQVKDLADALRHLAYEVKSLQEHERHEREKLTLQLENTLLRFERRLPPADHAGE